MINRILIRIKVVQMLYSYLLVEKDFELEPQPLSPTREKRFAHSLYMDYLVLMLKLSHRVVVQSGAAPLAESRFIRSVEADQRIRSLMMRYESNPFPLRDAIEPLAAEIKASAIMKSYLKERTEDSNADVDVWAHIFNHIILRDSTVQALMGRMENFSLRGADRAGEMVNITFTNFYASHSSPSDALKTLHRSLDAARELYFRLLLLPIDLTALREQQIDAARHKYLPSQEELNPKLRFVENALVERLRENQQIADYCKEHKLSWIEQDRPMLTALLKDIMESDTYREYMDFPATDLHSDCELWRNLYKKVILHNENFLAELEDKSVFWNDDLEIIGTFLLKSLKRFDTTDGSVPPNAVLPMYKDHDDEVFGQQLLSAAIRNKDSYRGYIDANINKAQWDTERIAFMDVVIMLAAIAEIVNFPSIPTNVSVNEYIEIAKAYSSHKSGRFVHGMLGNIIRNMRETNVIAKP